MPATCHPAPKALVLPWGAPTEAWVTALCGILIETAKLQKLGPLHQRAEKLKRTRRSPFSRKRAKSTPSLHKPLFRIPWFNPTFAIPGEDLLRELASTPILEVGAGSGALSLLVAAAGGDVIATDPGPWPMGYGYDHRDTGSDLSFAVRQRHSRHYAKTFQDRLRRPYQGVFHRMSQRYALCSRAGAPRMRFRKIGREPRPLRSLATYFPVERLDAKEAIRRYPDRDVLVSYPDPQHDWWVRDVLEGIAAGRRLYLSEDHGLDSTPEGYELVSRLTEHSFRLREKADGDNKGNTCAVLVKAERR